MARQPWTGVLHPGKFLRTMPSPSDSDRSDRKSSTTSYQPELPIQQIPALALDSTLAAIDLFAGIGGLSAGFREQGFAMTGVDHEPLAKTVYEAAGFGTVVTHDLGSEPYVLDAPVVLGGPPCRPWSAVNLQRRREMHHEHALLERFFTNVLEIHPLIVVMENVPALGSDSAYVDGTNRLRQAGYDVARAIVRYHEYGAATKRKRLFTVGIRGSRVQASYFFTRLQRYQRPARSVREEIEWLRDQPAGAVVDHDWSVLQSIAKYRQLYATGKYGWRKLAYDEPAPSFGSVAKTYILHPEAGEGTFPERVLSVREVMAIMGFDLSVRFPPETSRSKRYQMVANAVSPHVSRAIAAVVREFLTGSAPDRC